MCVTLSLVPLSCGQVHVDGPRVYAAPFPVRGVVGQLTIIKENVVAERSGWVAKMLANATDGAKDRKLM